MNKRTYQEYRRIDESKVPRMPSTHHIYLCMSNWQLVYKNRPILREKNVDKKKNTQQILVEQIKECRTLHYINYLRKHKRTSDILDPGNDTSRCLQRKQRNNIRFRHRSAFCQYQNTTNNVPNTHKPHINLA